MSGSEVCIGCEHWIGLHYNDVTGRARCRWEHHSVSRSGIIGIPITEDCDCDQFISARRIAKANREKEERDQRAEWVKRILPDEQVPQ